MDQTTPVPDLQTVWPVISNRSASAMSYYGHYHHYNMIVCGVVSLNHRQMFFTHDKFHKEDTNAFLQRLLQREEDGVGAGQGIMAPCKHCESFLTTTGIESG